MTAPGGRPALGETAAAAGLPRDAEAPAPAHGAESARPAPRPGGPATATRRAAGGPAATPPLAALLATVSWPEWRTHPLRNLTALLAVALGVALAFAVHLINESALAEFSAAVRSVDRQADFELRAPYRGAAGGFDEALYGRVALHPQVAVASPVVEVDTFALTAGGGRVALRLLGIDALVAGTLDPALLPQPAEGEDRLALLDPDAAFPNAAARQALGLAAGPATAAAVLRVQVPAAFAPGTAASAAASSGARVPPGAGAFAAPAAASPVARGESAATVRPHAPTPPRRRRPRRPRRQRRPRRPRRRRASPRCASPAASPPAGRRWRWSTSPARRRASAWSAGSAASTCGSPPAPTASACCASWRCRRACARSSPSSRPSASRTSRAPTAST